jgi:hypothetical protein
MVLAFMLCPYWKPLSTVVIALEHVLGKVVFRDLTSMPGIVFTANFSNTLEKS